MNRDPSEVVVDEIRAARSRISAQFDHDPKRLVAHYIELQKQYQDRLLPLEPSKRKDQNAA